MNTIDKKILDEQIKLLTDWNIDYLSKNASNIEQVRKNIETIFYILKES